MNTTKSLISLEKMESCASLLETELRQLTNQTSSFFIENNTVQPCVFNRESTQLKSKTIDKTSQVLPYVYGACNNHILFPSNERLSVSGKKVAVLFSGGPAAGGHNVVVGLKRVLGNENELYGVKAGPKGLLEGDLFLISDEAVDTVHNLGGFDFLGSDRTKIKTDEQFELVRNVVKQYSLDGIVVVGGDDSNTNAAFLAEKLADLNCTVVGVPKTIDGDLQVDSQLPISFGFDTATKVYSEMVGNILQDTPSSRKYWHFVKLMGRSASHVTLEVALQTHPHLTLISEEVAQKKQTLADIVSYIADTVIYRAKHGKQYGVIIIPEGLIEFIPELNELIQAINTAIASILSYNDKTISERKVSILNMLNSNLVSLFNSLPDQIQENLLTDRDAHGNLKVSQIPTELLLVEMVSTHLNKLKQEKITEGIDTVNFAALTHFFGYEGRCGAPSRFDATYTYNLGLTAGSLVLGGHTGYMVGFSDLDSGGKPLGIPLTGLIVAEQREGKESLVIEKALVSLDSSAFKYFESRRDSWSKDDFFSSPGPIQHWGPLSNQLPKMVYLNQNYSLFSFNID